jgi:branched-chain amino acid transport system permease protein
MEFGALVQNLFINTLVLSSMYILAALGFAFIFNMMGQINIAHGGVYMMAGYLCYYFSKGGLGVSNWVGMIMAVVVMAAFGIVMEKFFFRPFGDDFSRVVMVGVALMTALTTTATAIGGVKVQQIDSFATGLTQFGDLAVSNERILTFSIGIAILVVVLFVVNKTAFGRQMEAIAQDKIGAALNGIDIYKVSAIVCLIGCGLAAVAGSLMGAYRSLSPTMGDAIILRILMLVMLAGAGSMNGVIITGFIMGLLDSVLPFFFQGNGADAVASIIIVVLLLIRPKGFFGHEVEL